MAKVLVVDDNSIHVDLLAHELGRQGYDVAGALCGAEALERVAAEPPDAVLLDVSMPGMDGLEVCRRLKADPRWRAIPVIMITAQSSEEDIVSGLDAGADDYVSRPFDGRVLAARVRAAVRSKNAYDSLCEMNQHLERARRAAEAANEAKGRFLANISHEIRTPMTAILGFADLLRDSLVSAGDLEAIDTIKRNGEYLLEIINDILDLAKIEAGRFGVDLGPCSPRAVLADVVELMRLRAEAKGLFLEVAREEPLPDTIQCDSLRLRQILVNLIGNAIKFTDKGGVRVLTRLAPRGARTLIEFDVADTGIGMSDDELAMLFHPFYQADASAARRFGGTGLGLTISKRLAQMLDGDISVSRRPGGGSTFRLTIATGPD